MPAERAFSLLEITDILRIRFLQTASPFPLNTLFFKGVNRLFSICQRTVETIRGIDYQNNLIRFHAIPGVALEGADMEAMTSLP